jgi:two-component system NtrC family response regulator
MRTLKDMSILVADDDTRWLRALDRVLTSEGAAITRAQWAGQVLDILTGGQMHFDLLIMDFRMPFVTGQTLLYSVRNNFPFLPVIVLTAFGSPSVKAECLQQGAIAFVEKPVEAGALLAIIQGSFSSNPKPAEVRPAMQGT